MVTAVAFKGQGRAISQATRGAQSAIGEDKPQMYKIRIFAECKDDYKKGIVHELKAFGR